MNPFLSSGIGALVLVVVFSVQGCATASSPEENAADTASAVSAGHAKTVTFDDFAKIVSNNEMDANGGGDCSFASTRHGSSLDLTLTSADGNVKLSVSSHDRIVVTSKQEVFTYTIEGVGSVDILNADDAFNRVTVSTIGDSKSASCEVDF